MTPLVSWMEIKVHVLCSADQVALGACKAALVTEQEAVLRLTY